MVNKSFERLNTITAGIGMILSYAGFVFLVILANKYGNYWHLIWCIFYGMTLIILHTSSTFYHGAVSPKIKNILRYFDHSGIYILIAGTYTPIVLINLYGIWGWILFGVIWGLSIIGITLKVTNTKPFKNYENYLYLLMGWLAIVATKPLVNNIDFMGFLLIILGGVFFTIGIFFYIWDNKKYFHAIWHLFVLAGCTCHYFSILFYVIPFRV
tara:strand:- start:598 stop:1233 length:636 start_codon:yes stop_codon:yes gene_type:complete